MPGATIKIKRLTDLDSTGLKELIYLFNDVFEEKNNFISGSKYLKKILGNPSFWVYVAIFDGKIAGGLTAYELPKYYSEASEIFIYDIAVRREFQRKGIGKKLLSRIKKDANANGINEIFVSAHDEDQDALEFYKSTGGRPEKVTHFSYLLKKNRR